MFSILFQSSHQNHLQEEKKHQIKSQTLEFIIINKSYAQNEAVKFIPKAIN